MSSSSNPPPPSERASEIINKLPSSPNLITKAGTAVLGTGIVAAAISSELYVISDETVLLVGSMIFLTLVARVRLFALDASFTIYSFIFSRQFANHTATGPTRRSRASRASSITHAATTPRPSRTASTTSLR